MSIQLATSISNACLSANKFLAEKNFVRHNGSELTEEHSLKHYCICNSYNFQINNTCKKKCKVRVLGEKSSNFYQVRLDKKISKLNEII